MIADHTAAAEKMAAASQADGVAVPVGMTEAQQAEVATLSALKGPDFDAAYVQAQVAAHDEAVTLFETFAQESQPSSCAISQPKPFPSSSNTRPMPIPLSRMGDQPRRLRPGFGLAPCGGDPPGRGSPLVPKAG